MKFQVKSQVGSGFSIEGDSLSDAVRRNLKILAKEYRVGSPAGFKMDRVEIAANPNSKMGGKDFATVTLIWRGLGLANEPTDGKPTGDQEATKINVFCNTSDIIEGVVFGE